MPKSNAKTLQWMPTIETEHTQPVPLPVATDGDAYVRLPTPPARGEASSWTSQSYAYGAYTTSAGVNVGTTVVKATVSDWNASEALDELERMLLAALADVRAHERYQAGF